MSILAWSLLTFSAVATLLHVVTAAVVAWRARRPSSVTVGSWPPVTIIRPVCGLDDIERETLASTFRLDARDADLIFCAKSACDPAVAYLERLRAAHPGCHARILTGDDLGTQNPKLNNVVKGWQAAHHEWIILADSNLLLPPYYVARVIEAWRPNTGVVCAPPVGARPANFWAELECAFLNSYAARWQYSVDTFGYGFAQGKTMLWRRSELEDWGGIPALARDLAEDAAATKLVRAAGRQVRLAGPSFEQPLGHRTLEQVLGRQARWAQLRRLSFPWHFSPEILTGSLPALFAAWLGLVLLDAEPDAVVAGLLGLWLGTEAFLAWQAGWHLSWRSPAAWLLRDLLIPLVWARAWIERGYEWRGNAIDSRTVPVSANADVG